MPTVDMVMDMEHVAAITVSAVLAARDHNDVAAITDAVMDYGMRMHVARARDLACVSVCLPCVCLVYGRSCGIFAFALSCERAPVYACVDAQAFCVCVLCSACVCCAPACVCASGTGY